MYSSMPSPGSAIMKWWDAESAEAAAQNMNTVVEAIATQTEGISYMNLQHLKLYTDQDLRDFSHSAHLTRSYYTASGRISRKPIYWNIIKASVDALCAKIGKEKVRPSFLTTGSWIERQIRAERMDDFLFGLFKSSGMYKVAPLTLKNMCLFGTGIIYVYSEKCPETGEYNIKCERVLPDEIIVDPFDGMYTEPKSMYRKKFVSEQVLLDLGVEQKVIDKLPVDDGYGSTIRTTKTYRVYLGWHLPGLDSKGKFQEGRHTITCAGTLLHDEPWKRKRFPFAIARYTTDPIGFWGAGIAQELYGDQSEINRILNFIKESFILISNPRVYVPKGAGVSKQQMSNQIGGMVSFAGSMPPIIQGLRQCQAMCLDI